MAGGLDVLASRSETPAWTKMVYGHRSRFAEAVANAAVAALSALQRRFGREIVIEIDPTLDRERFQIVSV